MLGRFEQSDIRGCNLSSMKITLATPGNLDAIMEMLLRVQGMTNLGIDQWDEHYPTEKLLNKI